MSRKAAKRWWGINPPKEVAYYYRDDGYCWGDVNPNWKICTYKEIYRKKRERQSREIERKRASINIHPALIWVFYNNTPFFHGWWIYIRTIKKEYAINFRNTFLEKEMLPKIRNLYPLGILPLEETFIEWCEAFEKKYHRSGKKEKNAIAFCHVLIDKYGNLKDVYGKI